MLVLARKVGEEIVVGDDVHIRVVAITGNRVKLAFTAPREISIQRSELYWPAATVEQTACEASRRSIDSGDVVPDSPQLGMLSC